MIAICTELRKVRRAAPLAHGKPASGALSSASRRQLATKSSATWTLQIWGAFLMPPCSAAVEPC